MKINFEKMSGRTTGARTSDRSTARPRNHESFDARERAALITAICFIALVFVSPLLAIASMYLFH